MNLLGALKNWIRRRRLDVEAIRTKSSLPDETMKELQRDAREMSRTLTPRRKRRSHQKLISYPPTTKTTDPEDYPSWLLDDNPRKKGLRR